MSKTLDQLKVGDEVIVESTSGESVATIQEKLKTIFKLSNGLSYNRLDGFEYRQFSHRPSQMRAANEFDIGRVEFDIKHRTLKRKITKAVDILKMEIDTHYNHEDLERIYKCLKKEVIRGRKEQ